MRGTHTGATAMRFIAPVHAMLADYGGVPGSLDRKPVPRVYGFDGVQWAVAYADALEVSAAEDADENSDRVKSFVPFEIWSKQNSARSGARNKLTIEIPLDLRPFDRDLQAEANEDDLVAAMAVASAGNLAGITAEQECGTFKVASRVSMPAADDGIGAVAKAREKKPVSRAKEQEGVHALVKVARILLCNGDAFMWEGAGNYALMELLIDRFEDLTDHTRRGINAALEAAGKSAAFDVPALGAEEDALEVDFTRAKTLTDQELLNAIMPPSIDLL